MKGREGSVNVMGRKGGNRLFPTLTLTLTFHHPEQSLLHKLHWLDHVIRVGVFSRAPNTNIHTNTLRGLKIYLLFNRLVRRYVMSVNVNVGMYVMKEALLS